MRKPGALVGSAIFLVVAPGTFALWIPWMICRWHGTAPLPLRVVGALLILAGLPVLLDSFVRFALQGLGTPAPIAPPTHLVVTGWYRYVRNPMYVAVIGIVLGQALVFASVGVLEYAALAWLVTHLFVVFYEEPTLRRTFGSEYDAYSRAVHRWIPRLRPYAATGAAPRP
jgi:protein-S-isoprenylcysteine O-methyltransferase Ste14